MSTGHARERRRTSGERTGEPARTPELPPHQLLALQRSAGNQAVQRLVFNQTKRQLMVPKPYADQKLPWGGDHMESRDVDEGKDKTFLQIVNAKADNLKHVATGLGVKEVEAVSSASTEDMVKAGASLTGKGAVAGTRAALKDVAPAHDRLLVYPGKGTLYYDPGDIDSKLILKPRDFFPEESDLPGVGAKVRDQIPGAMKGQLLWNIACVLIALVKAEGHPAVKKLTGKTTTTLDQGVQALHDHYREANVEYDDTSSRFRVMNDWGYKPIFNGASTWTDLPLHVALPQGSYIFDITGHTVMVDVLQNIPKGPALATTAGYFTCHSDKDNYKLSEFTKNVQYIWAK